MTRKSSKTRLFMSMAAFCGLAYSSAITAPSAAPLSMSYTSMASAQPSHNAIIQISNEKSDKELKQAEAFINDLAKTAIGFLSNEALSTQDKEKQFKKLLNNRFDMRSIGRFAMGRYWRTASTDQQKEYLTLFNDMIVQVYSRRFSEYQGQAIEVISSRPEGKRDILVASFIKQDNGPDVRLDWRLRTGKDGKLKVIDIVVEGVSMALTQRSDFASVIQRGGGNVQILISHLEQKPE
tara:strand:- start:19140 stop:19850 length:711 start_codon:yes stop_codon:yes gene_type:complete